MGASLTCREAPQPAIDAEDQLGPHEGAPQAVLQRSPWDTIIIPWDQGRGWSGLFCVTCCLNGIQRDASGRLTDCLLIRSVGPLRH